jgi:hypothetical protein
MSVLVSIVCTISVMPVAIGLRLIGILRTAGHPVIEMFWQVVAALPPDKQSALLQFATSSDRCARSS